MKIFEITLFWLTFGPTYYGLMYIIGFVYGIWIIKKAKIYTDSQRESLLLYIFLWTVLGWRLWYILFYNLSSYISDPISILRVWEGWMSFHGWIIGVAIAMYFFTKKYKKDLFVLSDYMALSIPIWLFFWRIGNYINKELLGFPYEGPLAVITSQWSFFPSPLVEAFLEWACMLLIIQFVARKQKFTWQLAACFVIWYGIFRLIIELFIRTPDKHIGYYFGFISQWSILSVVMIIIWILFYYFLKNKHAKN